MNHAAIYDPYLDTLGGGERYCLTVAEILLSEGWQVDIFWSGDQNLIKLAETRFGLKLTELNIVPDIFGLKTTDIDSTEDQAITKFTSHKIQKHSLIDKYNITRKYQLCFFLNDGSIPFLFSQKNILHVQVPFINKINLKQKIINILKFKQIFKIICNSKFTSSYLPSTIQSKIEVIYPPVDIESMVSHNTKQNIILSVGRFDNILNAKKQDLMIETFKEFYKQNQNTDWKLVLMGGSRQIESENHYLLFLKKLAQNLPVEFIINPDYQQLKQIYSISKIYWHAAGYNIDETVHPELCEHFGMTPVEAMASGLVPILVNKGGLPEIITNGIEGYLWDTPQELLAKTQLLTNTPTNLQTMSQQAIEKAKMFSKSIFRSKLINLIQ